MTTRGVHQIPGLVQELYRIVRRFEELFPGRKFTPDGHLVGSIGEALAAYAYDLELLPASTAIHDARSREGRLVQIKMTQGKSVALRNQPEVLLVLKLMPDGTADAVYNGPGALAWDHSGKMQSNGQRAIGLARLHELMSGVSEKQMLTRVINRASNSQPD